LAEIQQINDQLSHELESAHMERSTAVQRLREELTTATESLSRMSRDLAQARSDKLDLERTGIERVTSLQDQLRQTTQQLTAARQSADQSVAKSTAQSSELQSALEESLGRLAVCESSLSDARAQVHEQQQRAVASSRDHSAVLQEFTIRCATLEAERSRLKRLDLNLGKNECGFNLTAV
jgi:hypothetical protein